MLVKGVRQLVYANVCNYVQLRNVMRDLSGKYGHFSVTSSDKYYGIGSITW